MELVENNSRKFHLPSDEKNDFPLWRHFTRTSARGVVDSYVTFLYFVFIQILASFVVCFFRNIVDSLLLSEKIETKWMKRMTCHC